MDRLFVIIGRINNVLLLVILIGTACSVALITFDSSQWRRRGAVEVPVAGASAGEKIMLTFEKVEDISGRDVQMMRLTTPGRSGKFSSGGYGNETRNVLFLTGAERVARWLFPDHKSLILVASQLRGHSDSAKEIPTSALYFEYVSKDTNTDGRLSSENRSSIGLARPDGLGFAEVLRDVDRVLSYQMLDKEHLSVVYQSGNAVRHAKFLVSSLALETDQKVIDVPNAL